ncbi:protein kinase:GAF [Sulfuricella denitrificans skB26]|uniref:Protein kinase:GAF n=1 Tax=Sulfuricella denitrificans (strain DSM 22764 / NBRC 105220 / skB26) TaxID=1163617 RepID=S6AB39_SULDS|nr:serine/threonine protein kinase [Sulfuricella denitrificans]BAN34283.1 protein kinase:GAF [Sulfuricella denitrificans skB26]
MLQNIGRFEVLRILGRGAQSVVYLAFDPQLQREVAIKTVHFAQQEDRDLKIGALIQESHTVSRLQHPNIVPIFEAGEHDSNPYLVFEYVEGKTLAAQLKEGGALPVLRAIQIIQQVLDAISHAHQHQIIHRDLKPSNILINLEGIPRVMDFGIATKISGAAHQGNDLMGTPTYMSPEYINTREVSIEGDIFATGLILCEMITGKRAVQGNDIFQILNKIVSGPIFNPAEASEFIDEKLGDIILKALAPNPLDRYTSAQEMRDALHAYMVMDANGLPILSEQSRKSTVDFLLRRMRYKSDFPALSESVSVINKIIASGGQDSFEKLSRAILKDVALTNKILRLVNSAYYGQHDSGKIATVSRAVVILGLDALRNLAVTLMLFDHMQNKALVTQLKDEFLRALFSAILAKEIATNVMARGDAEEVFICAMFHHLGRMLSLFYFPEETREIEKTMAQKEYSEEVAATQVLGISYQNLGMEIARIWGFPDQIVESMRQLPSGKIRKDTPYDMPHLIAAHANELCEAIADTSHDNRASAIQTVTRRFEDAVRLTEKQMDTALEKAVEEAIQYAGTIHLNLHYSQFGKALIDWAGGAEYLESTADDDSPTVLNTASAPGILAERRSSANANNEDERFDSQIILAEGLQNISQALLDNTPLNTLLHMVLEILHQGMGFQHVLLCIKDRKTDSMTGRFGLGPDIAQITRDFKFPLQPSNDVFHAVLSENSDILIADINAPKIRASIPDWYRKSVSAQTFILLPLSLNNIPVALIYADKKHAGDIALSRKELCLLHALRNQAALAFKHIT